MRRHAGTVIACSCLVTFGFVRNATAADRPIRFGVQASWADDADLGLGARAALRLGQTGALAKVEGVASFDYFFPEDPLSYWELNFNGLYGFAPQGKLVPYAGGGINIAHVSLDLPFLDASDTQVGLNLVGGARFELDTSSMQPFVEVKFEVEGGEEFVLSAGIRF